MRVLHVVRSLRAETGGIAEAVRNLAAAQRAQGDTVMIVSLDPADATHAGIVAIGRSSHGYGRAPEFVSWLQGHRGEYDVVIVHGLWQYQAYGTWRALRGTGQPYVVFPHGMLDVWFKRAHPFKHLKKWLYWPWADYRVLRDAAAVLYTAEDERRRARQSFWLYRAHERTAPIGIESPSIDLSRCELAFRASCPTLGGAPYLLFLGRIHPKKGVDLLLRGYAAAYSQESNRPPLVVAGPCDSPGYKNELVQLVRALAIEASVVWLPMLSGELKWGAIAGCDAFALFSHQENFGVAVVEALACARPVLLSDQVAIAADIERQGAALVASDNAEGATCALSRWRATPLPARRQMSEAARNIFLQHYEIGRAAEALAAVIGDVRAVK